MKRKRTELILFAVSVMLVAALSGCSIFPLIKDYEEMCAGDFRYIVVDDYEIVNGKEKKCKSVAIVGFSWSGIESEVIDIPQKLDGKPVRYIGYQYRTSFAGRQYHLHSDNLKKMYISENVSSIYTEAFYALRENGEEPVFDVMLCAVKNPSDLFYYSHGIIFYLYRHVYEDMREEFLAKYPDRIEDFESKYHRANVTFKNNYSDEVNGGYYRLDNVAPGETVPMPPAPERDGYAFIGWYTEAECVNAWNFDVSPELSEDSDFILYACWHKK
ncbi:MAG: InlB B-repeat-containing protein [Clostridia bacterium]|nr:InlB B-repeat-containing protein [Clostridia bacterium]